MMEKSFDPARVEPRIAELWETSGAFRAGRPERAKAEPYCIVIPPPNVTGNLHMGHALNNTLQDVLCRYHRMKGRDVLWQPGTDHAGIATQMVVERRLAETQQPDRRTMGREKFLERVWAWKEDSGGAIVQQLKRLGASCDWSRERFTLDAGLSKAVAKVFVQLHRDGLVFKAKRLVNWDPKFQTAISDLEVVQVDCKGTFAWSKADGVPLDQAVLHRTLTRSPSGHLYTLNYPVVDAGGAPTGEYLSVATTRPETMLGDSAVAVHPEDPRYTHLIGAKVRLPWVGRLLQIVGDDYSDPEKGTGAVKITPAHDFNDFEVGRRHQDKGALQINILDSEAKISLQGNTAFFEGLDPEEPHLKRLVGALEGVDRTDARALIVGLLAESGHLEKVEPHAHTVPHGDRSNVAIEPWLTDQWYVDAKALAVSALEAVRSGETVFVPKNWEKIYFEWLENIQPWCVSRQLWWGHQIPAWYTPWGTVHVEEDEEAALAAALAEGLENGAIAKDEAQRLAGDVDALRAKFPRDEDVLDTWFSSALWPFSTLGWPEETPEVARYYPTAALVTGFDIIFFWVARMMMMGKHFLKQAPFRDIYIHALVRDEKGVKMSKSKGNVMDPLDIVDGIDLAALVRKRTESIADKAQSARIAADTKKAYPQGIPALGVDSLRFFLAAMAAPGRDVKLSLPRIEGYRNFATKLWNASRFAEMNGCARRADFDVGAVRDPLNRWILSEASAAVADTASAIDSYRFDDAAASVYRFVWNVFCDWHLELVKPTLQGASTPEAKAEAQATVAYVLDVIYAAAHPFMPFITEELWGIKAEEGPQRVGPLALGPWPESNFAIDAASEAEIGRLIALISEIRSARSETGVPAGAQPGLIIVQAGDELRASLSRWAETIKRLARVADVAFSDSAPSGSLQILAHDVVAAIPVAGLIDAAVEGERLAREIAKEHDEVAKTDAKLGNPDFLARAPEDVVIEHQERRLASLGRIGKLTVARDRLARM